MGKGDFNWFLFEVYEARLWADHSSSLFSHPLTLELSYKRNFKGKDIVEQTLDELKHIGVSQEVITKWNTLLYKIFPDIKAGDTISANYHPSQGIVFYLNMKVKIGELKDPEFSREFLSIWLSEKTSAPELRRKLLGQS